MFRRRDILCLEMRVTTANINDAGQLVGFGLHDAVVVGLAYEEGTHFLLRSRRGDGRTVSLRLEGVGPVGALGLRLPAIISEVFAWHPESTPKGAATLRDGAWNVLFAGDVTAKDVDLAIRGAVGRNEFAYLVHIGCSFGGAVSALCRDVHVLVENE
jgi:hypothetical protein